MIVFHKWARKTRKKTTCYHQQERADGFSHYPLRIESLEQRVLLAFDLLVNTADDLVDGDVSSASALIDTPGGDGLISLREAVLATNATPGVDTILFADTLDGLPMTLTIEGRDENSSATGDLDITDGLILQGRGRSNTIIDALGIDRVFEILFSSNMVSIFGMTIRGGVANSGGGISNSGTLTISQSSISANQTSDGGDGGGIYNRGTIQSISSSTISGNSADRRGGGIYNGGTIENISESTISGNLANSLGGGIFNTNKIVSISASTISGNLAGQNGGGIAIYNQGGSFAKAIIESISESILFGNTAANGSAIYNGSSLIRFTESTIAENNVTRIEGSTIDNLGHIELLDRLTINDNTGRGIGNRGTIQNISHNTIFGNYSQQDGGGIFNFDLNTIENISFSMIYGNETEQNGGGISNRGAIASISNSSIFGNDALENGGGISNVELGVIGNISNNTISENNAESGGGIYNSATIHNLSNSTISDNFSLLQGAGIKNQQGTIARLISTIIANNTSADSRSDLSNQGTINLAGYNLIESPDGHSIPAGVDNNLIGVDPLLGLFDNHRGPTLSYALLPGSPAIDAGDANFLEFDQRGETFARVFGESADIGAYERQPDFQIHPFPYQNPNNPFDVNDNGLVNSLDLLQLIRDINTHGNRSLPLRSELSSPFVDVNGDNVENPLDVVILIIELNRIASSDFISALEDFSVQVDSPKSFSVETVSTSSILATNTHPEKSIVSEGLLLSETILPKDLSQQQPPINLPNLYLSWHDQRKQSSWLFAVDSLLSESSFEIDFLQ